MVREPTVGDVTGDGAVDVWRTFYERSFPEVTQYAMRLTGGRTAAAEDLVHDGYLAMMRAWHRGAVDGLETGWLMVTVRNVFLNGLRHDRREGRRLRLVHDSPTVQSEPSMVELDELLRTVSDRQRAALVLRYVDDLPVAEVAECLGLTVHATESLLARARGELRRQQGGAQHG